MSFFSARPRRLEMWFPKQQHLHQHLLDVYFLEILIFIFPQANDGTQASVLGASWDRRNRSSMVAFHILGMMWKMMH